MPLLPLSIGCPQQLKCHTTKKKIAFLSSTPKSNTTCSLNGCPRTGINTSSWSAPPDTPPVTPPQHSEHPPSPRKIQPCPIVRFTGATVLVRVAPSDAASATRYRSGMVSDANDDGGSLSYDVIYDEAAEQQGAEQQEEEEDEEDGVAADRVLGVPVSPCVWCAARLNLARCSFRRGGHAEVRRRGRRRSMVARIRLPREALMVSFPDCCLFLSLWASCVLWFSSVGPSCLADVLFGVSRRRRESDECPIVSMHAAPRG